MSLEHKNIIRVNDEFLCKDCGKSWDVTDRDVPECSGKAVFESTPTGRIRPSSTSMALAAMAAASPMTIAQATEQRDKWRRQNSALIDQLQSKGVLTNADFSKLEERCVAAAVEGSGMESFFSSPWPSPLPPTVQAYLAYDVEDKETAMLIYAESQHQAHQYAIAVTRLPATIEVRRLQGMDASGIGRTPYVDANPRNLQKASKMARRKVINLLQWRRA